MTATPPLHPAPVRGQTVLRLTVVLLPLGWLIGLSILFSSWATVKPWFYDPGDDVALARQLDLEVAWWQLWFGLLLVGGPLLIAVLAAVGRFKITVVVFGIIGVLLAVPAGYLALDAWRTLHPAPAPPAPEHCIERSGGDTRCPGG
ncbi:DUF6234 family protein [Micromonospora sp. NPDC003197]